MLKTPRPEEYDSIHELEAFVKVIFPNDVEFTAAFKKEKFSPVDLFAME